MKSFVFYSILLILVMGFAFNMSAYGQVSSFTYPKVYDKSGYYPDQTNAISAIYQTGNQSIVKALGVKVDLFIPSDIVYDEGKSLIQVQEYRNEPLYFPELYDMEHYMYQSYERDTYFLSFEGNGYDGVTLKTNDIGNDQHYVNYIIYSNFVYPTDFIKVKTTLYYLSDGKILTSSSMGTICPEKCMFEIQNYTGVASK